MSTLTDKATCHCYYCTIIRHLKKGGTVETAPVTTHEKAVFAKHVEEQSSPHINDLRTVYQ